MLPLLIGLALLPASAGGSAGAPVGAASRSPSASTVIYRCTAADGAVALQDEPCPRGQRQETREIAAFAPPRPGPAPAASASAAEAVAPPAPPANDAVPRTDEGPMITLAEAPASPARLFLPPPLWRCTSPEGASRLSEVDDPQPRCVPLSMLGVDLSRAPPAAASLCRTIEDDCVELGGEAACAAWRERLASAESALLHAFSDDALARRAERERARAIVEGDCRP